MRWQVYGEQYIKNDFHFPKEWFSDLVEVPFETITIPIPREYDKILRLKIGDNYMTPIRQETHNYPFYKTQEKILEKKLKEINPTATIIETVWGIGFKIC